MHPADISTQCNETLVLRRGQNQMQKCYKVNMGESLISLFFLWGRIAKSKSLCMYN